MLAMEVAILSERGGRPYNEDACGHWHSRRHLACVLADGAGGHDDEALRQPISVSGSQRPVDWIVSEVEGRWGVDRLVWLVGGDLRDRFEKQMDKLNAAIDKCDPSIEHEVEVTLRGVAALEAAAIAAGAKPLNGDYVEGRMPDGRVIAITATGYEAGKVKRDNREMVVYSVDEVGRIIEGLNKEAPVVDAIKNAFAGAEVQSVKPVPANLDDEIPF